MNFDLINNDGAARRGCLTLAHGQVDTLATPGHGSDQAIWWAA